MALLADLLNVIDQATMGRAPSIMQLTTPLIMKISGSMIPAHARNGALEPGTGKHSQRDFAG